MVLMDSISSQALSVREVKHETNALYADALNDLREKGVAIQSMVCDGRKGLLQLFPEIPAQLYQFHQVKTVSRYLTRNPKTAACKALFDFSKRRLISAIPRGRGAEERRLRPRRAKGYCLWWHAFHTA